MAGAAKWFRVATEGATTDGRKIARETIEKMASNYDPRKYGARIWLEHIRGLFADSAFRALGDVAALKAEVVEGKLALFAQLSPTADLVKLAQDRQKIFTSIEIDPSFADTGEPYLVGLGVTDTPASLGTDVLAFHAGGAGLLAHRKQRKENEFSAAEESDIQFTAEEPESGAGLLERVKNLLSNFTQNSDKKTAGIEQAAAERFAALSASITAIAEATADLRNSFAKSQADASTREDLAKLRTDLDALSTQFTGLQNELHTAPDPSRSTRPPATGAGDRVATDC